MPLPSSLKRLLHRGTGYLRDRRQFESDYKTFGALVGRAAPRLPLRDEDRFRISGDKTATTGFDTHYVYHVSWASRVLARTKPAKHIDVSSSLFFVGAVSAFVPITFYDYRPASLMLDNLESKAGDLMSLPFADKSVGSLSCMHVVEHIGLGRYGEPFDVDGDLKAMAELKRVIAPGGQLLFVTPLGRPRICFNAHRVYGFGMIREQFKELALEEFMLVGDDALERGPVYNATEAECDRQSYGCGCFLFRRPATGE